MTEAWLAPYLDRMEEISRRFFRYFHARIEAAGGLSPSQFFLLKLLQVGGTASVGDLAQKMGMSTAGATGLLDRMERADLLERARDEADRRVVWVRLSPSGEAALQAEFRLRRQILADLVSPLTPAEVAHLIALYEKIATQIVPGPEAVERE